MAELVRNYFDNLQTEGLAPNDEQEEALKSVLNSVTIKLSPAEKLELKNRLTKANVEEVLRLLPSGKAPGIDGVPYEFWKWVNEKSKSAPRTQDKNEMHLNFMKCLMAVYNDIELNGVATGSCFAEGLLNPLHKKKD
ncbi:hypothetical protein EDD22DRAFT_848230 [Suillus occidentalis]|nr:hypothetical protein EDD22DRAFT_848230 [Suillus occidentalis]